MNLSAHYIKVKRQNPWEKTHTVSTTKKKSKKTAHEIFCQMNEREENKFWKRLFKECSLNKLPANYSFKNNILSYKNGNQTKELSFDEDLDTNILNCKEFFNKHTGIMSPIEREKERKDEEKRKKEQEEVLKWDIKLKKYTQITLIYEYIDRVAEEKEMNEEEKQEMVEFINYHLILKNLQSRHFILENSRLETIENIEFDEKIRKWRIVKGFKANRKKVEESPAGKGEVWWKVDPAPIQLDAAFDKQIELICKANISAWKFVPSSSRSGV